MTQNILKRPINALGFMNVILLCSGHIMFQPLMWPIVRMVKERTQI